MFLALGCGGGAASSPLMTPRPPEASSPPATPTPPPRHSTTRGVPPVYHPPLLHGHPRHVHPMVTRHAVGTLRSLALGDAQRPAGLSLALLAPFASPCRILTSVTQCWRNTRHFSPTKHEIWYPVRPAPTSSPASGSGPTSGRLMVPLRGTRLAGFFGVSLNTLESTMMRLSAQW